MSEELVLTVEVAARPETVFALFTDPASFDLWMGAAMGKATLVPEKGGEVRVDFPAFAEFPARVVRGEVLALEPYRRFTFTWGYERSDDLPPGASTIEITLTPTDLGTTVELRHTGLPTDELRRAHRGGFRLYLSVLAARAADAQHAAGLDGTVAAWFEAWNADDVGARRAALERCLTEDGEFRHAFAAVRGRDDLSGHIASSRAVMQGIRLEPNGRPELCHAYARFGWEAVREGGVVSTGENFAVLAGDGRFALVAGFRDGPD
ncbi:MAG: SRPBCC domain-containing protein [Gemmatimonadota bacterium]